MIDGIGEYPCSWVVKKYLGVEDGGGKEEKERERIIFVQCSSFSTWHSAFNGRCPKHFKLILLGISILLCLKSCLSIECLLSL